MRPVFPVRPARTRVRGPDLRSVTGWLARSRHAPLPGAETAVRARTQDDEVPIFDVPQAAVATHWEVSRSVRRHRAVGGSSVSNIDGTRATRSADDRAASGTAANSLTPASRWRPPWRHSAMVRPGRTPALDGRRGPEVGSCSPALQRLPCSDVVGTNVARVRWVVMAQCPCAQSGPPGCAPVSVWVPISGSPGRFPMTRTARHRHGGERLCAA